MRHRQRLYVDRNEPPSEEFYFDGVIVRNGSNLLCGCNVVAWDWLVGKFKLGKGFR